MGSNNRARRQQKQRQKQKKTKNTARTPRRELIQLDELEELCRPVVVSLNNGEPPSACFIKEWLSLPIPPAANPLRTLLVSFVDYVFHEKAADGTFDQLIPYQRQMKRADLSWLYGLLSAYCLVNDVALAEHEWAMFSANFEGEDFPQSMGLDDHQTMAGLCAPFYLLLWIMGHSTIQQRPNSCRRELGYWLDDSPFESLVPYLDKFLALKHPKPNQKTTAALEHALGQLTIDPLYDDPNNVWITSISQLLTLFFQQRVAPGLRNSEVWSDCPQLSLLAGLDSSQALRPEWSSLLFSEGRTNIATLHRLENQITTEAMSYEERVSLEAVKCRILASYLEKYDEGKRDFEYQLGHLTHLLTRNVPPSGATFSEQCLSAVCEWLANEVTQECLAVPSADPLRQLYRHRPDDYRIALLLFLATCGRKPSANSETAPQFQHIHSSIFCLGLNKAAAINEFLALFYWPLTGETKKLLFIQSCRQIFLGRSQTQAKRNWEQWKEVLFERDQAPFITIIEGQACESEMLFYMALAAVDGTHDADWLHAEHMTSIVHSAAELLGTYASEFNQRQIAQLFNTLVSHPQAASLFHHWEPVLAITRLIDDAKIWEPFLRLAVTMLKDQPDHLSTQYSDLYKACRPLPTLQRYLPGKKKTAKRKKSKKASSATGDLF